MISNLQKERRNKMGVNVNVIRELSSFDIFGTSELSDTIVSYGYGTGKRYANMQSGIRSSCFNDTIRDGKGYIFIDNNLYPENSLVKGMLARYIPEHDILLVVIYDLNASNTKFSYDGPVFSWEERLRVIISRSRVIFMEDGEVCKKHPTVPYAHDLCGQFIHIGTEGFNITGLSGDEVRRFAKGVWWDGMEQLTFYNMCNINTVVLNITEGDVNFGMREINMDGITLEDKPLPGHVIEMIGKTVRRCFENYIYDCYKFRWNDFLSWLKIGYLQNCGGEYVLRVFAVAVKGNVEQGSETMPIRHIEIERIHLTEDVLEHMRLLCVPLLYFDRENIDDGIFRYTKKYLEEAEKCSTDFFSSWNYYCAMPSPSKYGISVACAATFMPFFEKLLNIFVANDSIRYDCPSSDYYANRNICRLKFIVMACTGSLKLQLCKHMGKLDFENKELNQALGIPKTLMKMLIQGDCGYFDNIKIIKSIFSRHKKYFMSLDSKTLMEIIELINADEITSEDEPSIKCLKMLISIFGTDNIIGYCKFILQQSNDYEWCETYMHYLEKLKVIGKSVKGLQWKLKGSELERADESIHMAYVTLNDKKKYANALSKFKLHFDVWEKYKYSDDKFTVIYPQGPTDLIEEGVKLNHCVKTFIDSVACGKTMILFIRRNENISKPFYTLEIRDGEIRQCHGFDNCDIDQCDGLTEFIERFSKEKHLTISSTINKVFGAY